MASFEFNPAADGVRLSFKCSCGEVQRTDFISIPSPDFGAEKDSDSDVYNDDQHECSHCHKVYEITIRSSVSGGDGEIHDLDDVDILRVWEDWKEEEAYYDNLFDEIKDEIKEDRKYSSLFFVRMVNIIGLLDTVDKLSKADKNALYPMLYVNIIASMEAYLADTFIRSVLKSDENKRKFVETFKDFEKEQISLQRIYEKMDGMDKFISKTLRDVIYHNLGKVKGMYKDTLGVDLGDIKELMKAVNKRHDIVHRNCKDKEGNDVIITKTDVEELFERVKNFVNAIDAQVHPEHTV